MNFDDILTLPMRILYAGNSDKSSTGRFYAKAFRNMGHKCEEFDPRFFQSDSKMEQLLIRARRGPLLRSIRNANQQLQRLVREGSFDLVFVMGENYFTDETIAFVASQRAKILYHSHDNPFSEGICKSADFLSTLKSYDFVFTTKSQNVLRYRSLGQAEAHFVPSAYEPSIHRPSLAPIARFDFTFVGTYAESRVRYLNAVGWQGLNVIGNSWDRFPHYQKHSHQISPQSVYESQYAESISLSKVTLGLLREEAQDRHSQRTFEIPACGSAQIAPRNEEICRFFEENREIVCFDSPEELKDKSRFLLSHDRYRCQIARAGFERVTRDKHTYQDRAQFFLKTIL